jgi:hypothetical protein
MRHPASVLIIIVILLCAMGSCDRSCARFPTESSTRTWALPEQEAGR